MIKLIKYNDRIQNQKPIAFDNDRAMAEFRGFSMVADPLIDRVSELEIADVLEEVISQIQAKVQSRKKALA